MIPISTDLCRLDLSGPPQSVAQIVDLLDDLWITTITTSSPTDWGTITATGIIQVPESQKTAPTPGSVVF